MAHYHTMLDLSTGKFCKLEILSSTLAGFAEISPFTIRQSLLDEVQEAAEESALPVCEEHQAKYAEDGNLKRFFATFMQKQATKRLYVEILCMNAEQAHAAMHEHFGVKWAFMYPEEKFISQIEEFSMQKLLGIHVIDHGSSIEYRIA